MCGASGPGEQKKNHATAKYISAIALTALFNTSIFAGRMTAFIWLHDTGNLRAAAKGPLLVRAEVLIQQYLACLITWNSQADQVGSRALTGLFR
jgi:hypothetical protein